jgi:uncharacterized protein with GYD domain
VVDVANVRAGRRIYLSWPRFHAGGRAGLRAMGKPGRTRQGAARRRPDPQEKTPVPTYVLLSTLSPEGVQTIKNNPQRIREVNNEVEQLGATVKAQWATLGRFDFVNIVEAPDEATMARVSLELGSRGTSHYESLTAIPVDEFIASL